MGGTAFVFVPLLAAAAIAFFIVAVVAAHYFLALVEMTAHGQRSVRWPGDAFLEWLPDPVKLGWIAGPWVMPAVLLSTGAGAAMKSTLAGAGLSMLAFALLFPFGAVSAFVAGSPWFPFHPRAVPLVLRKPGATLAFYLVAVTATAAGVGGMYLATLSVVIGGWGALAGGFVASFAWFVYACALGRFLFAVTYDEVKRTQPAAAAEPTEPPPPGRPKAKKAKKPTRPPVIKGGYGVKAEDAPPPADDTEPAVPHWERPKPAWDKDADDSPYTATAPEVALKDVVGEQLVKPKESEMKLFARDPGPPPPDPWDLNAFAPLGQSETMRSVLFLGILLAVLGGIGRLLIQLNPV